MKKLTFILLLIVMIVPLVACGDKKCDHTYDNDCDSACNVCQESRVTTHIYDNDCDTACNVCQESRVTTHVYDNDCDSACNVCQESRVTTHIYNNDCDTVCNLCKETREITHTYSEYESNIAKHVKKCSVCGMLDERTREEHVYNDEYACACGYKLIVNTSYPSNNGARYVKIFSPNKDLMFIYRYNVDGEMYWSNERYYDEKGNEVRHLESSYIDGKIDTVNETVHTYDEQGRRIREDYYNIELDGTRMLSKYNILTYSDDGIHGTVEFYDSEGNKTAEDLCIYDTKGNISTRVYLNSNRTLNNVGTYIYDINGREIQTLTFQDAYYRITDYNAYHDVIKHSYYYDDGRIRIQSYTENGDLFSDETSRPDGTKTTDIYEKGIKVETVHEKDGVVTDRVTYE